MAPKLTVTVSRPFILKFRMAYSRGTRSRKGSKAKSRARRATRRAPYKKRKSTAALQVSRNKFRIPIVPQLFPNTKLVRHRYCDTITLPASAAAGNAVKWVFRCNSMYDPDFTGTGHQPMFRDEMAAQYNYYTVLASTIKVSFPPENDKKQNVQLWTDDDSVSPIDPTTARETHLCYQAIKLDKRNTPLVCTSFYDAARWNKTTKKGIMADNDQKTQAGSNPSGTATKYYIIYTSPVDSTESLTAQKIDVDMIFYTMWREPVDHVGS